MSNIKEITDSEILLLAETLEAMMEEIDAVQQDTGFVFTTGIEELIRESNIIIDPLIRKIEL